MPPKPATSKRQNVGQQRSEREAGMDFDAARKKYSGRVGVAGDPAGDAVFELQRDVTPGRFDKSATRPASSRGTDKRPEAKPQGSEDLKGRLRKGGGKK